MLSEEDGATTKDNCTAKPVKFGFAFFRYANDHRQTDRQRDRQTDTLIAIHRSLTVGGGGRSDKPYLYLYSPAAEHHHTFAATHFISAKHRRLS